MRAVKFAAGLILLSVLLPACRPEVLTLIAPTASPAPTERPNTPTPPPVTSAATPTAEPTFTPAITSAAAPTAEPTSIPEITSTTTDFVFPNIEPSILDPMLAPSVTLSLPTLPEGFYWQGVEIIEFAIPVPEGWFVAYLDLREVFGWEYWFEYTVTREDPTQIDEIASKTIITVIKDKDTVASERAAELFTGWQNTSIRVIDTQVIETENTVTYHLYVEGPHEIYYPDETRYTILLADKSNNVLYVILSASPTTEWDEFWIYGQVMSQRLVDLLQD